jgi:hypothetical protein
MIGKNFQDRVRKSQMVLFPESGKSMIDGLRRSADFLIKTLKERGFSPAQVPEGFFWTGTLLTLIVGALVFRRLGLAVDHVCGQAF